MIAGRDSRGRFTKGNVPWSKRVDGRQRGVTTFVGREVIDGGRIKLKLVRVGPKLRLVSVGPKVITEGIVKLERIQVICPACGEQIEAVARDSQVKGYCAVAKQYVDFPIETQLERKNYQQGPEYRAKQSIAHMGKHHTAETKAKLSAAHMGKHRQHAAETRVKISSALMGKPLTAETKAKISAAMKGKPLTPEHRAKISAVLKGRHNKKESE